MLILLVAILYSTSWTNTAALSLPFALCSQKNILGALGAWKLGNLGAWELWELWELQHFGTL